MGRCDASYTAHNIDHQMLPLLASAERSAVKYTVCSVIKTNDQVRSSPERESERERERERER